VSLFTSEADHDLPILSQLYQIDPDNNEEQDTWTARCCALWSPETEQRWRSKSRGLTAYTAPEAQRREYREIMRQLHPVALRIMDGLADKGRVLDKDLIQLRKIRLLCLYRALNTLRGVERDAGGYVAAGEVPKATFSGNSILTMLAHITEEVYDLCREPIRVRRCMECHSAYIVRRAREHRYCSMRCRTRARMRRLRDNRSGKRALV
jgi:hypothetical protein